MRQFFLTFFLFLSVVTTLNAQEIKTKTELAMEKAGFILISQVDSTIPISLMYSRPDNFMGRILYTDLNHAYLHSEAARALHNAQLELKKVHPSLSLKVYDAARPMHIQQTMWDAVKGTSIYYYVSNPAHGGGLHNYGLAVDVTLCNVKEDTIPMGTKIDYMGNLAHIDQEAVFVKKGLLSKKAYNNRRALRSAMRTAGFTTIRTEWWHFNFKSRDEARAHYKAIK